jgi:hypothetical protein
VFSVKMNHRFFDPMPQQQAAHGHVWNGYINFIGQMKTVKALVNTKIQQ